MYKVFVNENPIILTDLKRNQFQFKLIPFLSADLPKLISLLEQNLLKGICLYHPDLAWMWREFQSHFKVIEAAGGLVLNNQNQVLMIYRNKKWDLPKGKIDITETPENAALREVEEECNIKKITIVRPLSTTYHIYFDYNKKRILKISYWFEMHNFDQENLIPQKEEGILKVEYLDKNKLAAALCNTYATIKILFDEIQLKN